MIVIEKSWGYEEIIHNGDYCCKALVYTRPIASSLHYHPKKHETFVVASGMFEIEVHSQPFEGAVVGYKRTCMPGTTVKIQPGEAHRVRCLKIGTIIEASTHDDPADCVRLVPSET